MRLFFALQPPADLAEALAGEALTLSRRYGGRPARPETIHLTLAFLGEVAEERLPDVLAAGRAVQVPEFDLTIDRFALWPHNGVLWAGCAPPADGLFRLVTDLREQLRAASIAFDGGSRFVPHVSLVRRVRAHEKLDLPAMIGKRWTCSDFALIRSRLMATGSDYTLVESFPLLPRSLSREAPNRSSLSEEQFGNAFRDEIYARNR